MYQRLAEKVRAGQVIAEGAAWLEPDTNLPGGEALIRQLLYGRRFFREEFGIESELFWEPDVFGYSGALPQIMRGCGVKYFATQKLLWVYNDADPFPYSTFEWEGIDGSTVLAQVFRGYNNEASPAHTIENWRERIQQPGLTSGIYSFGWGDGGGGAQRDHLEYLRRQSDLEGAPRMRIDSPVAFFKSLEQSNLPLPRYVGELYFACHRGTYTSQARIKQANRRSEWALREAEMWSTAASAYARKPVPAQKLDAIWKKLLLNQFHDILPGSSIQRVSQESENDHEEIRTGAAEVAQQAARDLTRPGSGLVLFNSLPWPRKVMVALPTGQQGAVDSAGVPLDTQLDKGITHVEMFIPACGWTTIYPGGKAIITHTGLSISPYSLENKYLRIRFDEFGRMISLFDKDSDSEWLQGPGNDFRLFHDVPSKFDAWDIDSLYKLEPLALANPANIEILAQGPLWASLRITRTINQSRLTQEVRLLRSSRRIEFISEIDWHERHKLLKVAFPFNIHANQALHEIQFGHLARPTHASRPYDADRFEVSQHKWSALVEGNRGVGLLNDSKYGISVEGSTMALTLLKSALAPDMNADQGIQRFVYAIYPWQGNFFESPVIREAYELNAPQTCIQDRVGEGWLFRVNAANIILETVKPAEDGSPDLVLRLYESKHAATRCRLETSLPVRKIVQTDMQEHKEADLSLRGRSVELDFRAFEIKTLRLVLK